MKSIVNQETVPIISIIIPMYNAENFINKCLDSIWTQTFWNYEVIIINDGSTDASLKIVQKYVENDSRFRVVSIDNGGEANARQIALSYIRGAYIVSVDSDDWVEPTMLEDIYCLCVENAAEVVCYGWNKDSDRGTEYAAPTIQELEIVNGVEMIKRFYTGAFYGTLTCYMFARHLFADYQFPKDISVGCDFAALFYALQRTDKVVATNKAYYHYIQRSGSAVHSSYNKGKLNAFYFEKEIRKQALDLLPEIKDAILVWYIQNNVFLVSSMCRSEQLDQSILGQIVQEIREHYWTIAFSPYMKFPFKIGALLLGMNSTLYIKLYEFLYHHLGLLYTKVTGNASG